jgi:mRNA interferase MazF
VRGSIWWADLGPARGSAPAERRPVVVVSSDRFNASKLNTVVVVVLTTNQRLAAMPGNVAVPVDLSGLPRDSVVNVTSLMSIDRRALEDRVGELPPWVVGQIDAGLRQVLGLDRPGALRA